MREFWTSIKIFYPVITAGIPKMIGLNINWLNDFQLYLLLLICQIWFVHCITEVRE